MQQRSNSRAGHTHLSMPASLARIATARKHPASVNIDLCFTCK
jgi:hypothetical protein